MHVDIGYLLTLVPPLQFQFNLVVHVVGVKVVSDRERIPRPHQAITPSYKFDCDQMCGSITEWGVDVCRDGRIHQPLSHADNSSLSVPRPYTLGLQVWRPSPTVDDFTC